jgi:hypothetical protein
MPQIDSKSLLLSNLNKILINHLEATINHIHYRYKKYFTEENVKEVLEMVTSNITFQDMGPEELENINKKITKQIIDRQVYNSGIYKNKHSIPEDNERCKARIWANGYVNKQNEEPNSDVSSDEDKNDDEDDDEDEDNNNDNTKISFGKRCSRRINDNCLHHKYCGHHMKNNPHGDYNSPLKKFQTLNFIKNSKVLNHKS